MVISHDFTDAGQSWIVFLLKFLTVLFGIPFHAAKLINIKGLTTFAYTFLLIYNGASAEFYR